MSIQISKSEMRILGYLHEHATGFDQRFMFKPADVCKALGLTLEQLQRDTSFISSHGLTGVKSLDMTTMNGVHHNLVGLWLTGNGENMMRNLEAEMEEQLLAAPDYQPGVGAKITLKAAEFLWDTAKGVLVMKITQWLSSFVPASSVFFITHTCHDHEEDQKTHDHDDGADRSHHFC